jgi:DNA-binding transcriptional MerR regulator
MNKSPDAFRTISEVAEDLDLPQHVLRFWETRFREIKPLKRGGGRRYYRPDDVELLRGIKHLLYDEGYTIRGLQRILKEQGTRFVVAVGKGEISADSPESLPPLPIEDVREVPPRSGPEPLRQVEADVEPEVASTKRALTVSEINASPKPRGIFDRFRMKEPIIEEERPLRNLSPEERRSLQATLYELLECKRLLDQVRGV